MNFFGVDILQLIVYGCVFACVIIVAYILKLQRSKKKTEPAENELDQLSEDIITIRQLITLIDKMYSHQIGLTSDSCTTLNVEPETPTTKEQTEKKPEPQKNARLSKVNEETYVQTQQDNELLERLKERLKEKG